MTPIFAVLVLTLVASVLWGVGQAIQRASGSPSRPWPVSIGVGLAATIAAGGLLNLARIAYSPVLWALAGAQLVVSAFELRRIQWKFDYDSRSVIEIASAALVIGSVTIFAILTQLPPKVFNSHDDLQKYFAYPVRMLATGTLSGSPLSSLGVESLGGQAFLHGLTLSVFPIGFINGVDAVFGLLALLLLTAAAGWRRFSWFPGALVGPLLVATINPQYTNISALYLGSFLMATAVMLVANAPEGCFPAPLVLGLVYAALVAIKPTLGIFVVCHFPFAMLALGSASRSWRKALAWASRVLATATISLAPWVALHLPLYLARSSFARQSGLAGADGKLNLLSTATLFYGASFLDYTAIVIVTALIAVMALFASRSDANPCTRQRSLAILAGAASGVLAYIALVMFLGKVLNGYEGCLRYSVPYLLGACVISIVMAPDISRAGRFPQSPAMLFPLFASLVICAAFTPSMAARYKQAIRFGSILAFAPLAESSQYAAYNQFCLSDTARQYVLGFQDQVPQGTPLLAWINTPYLLDYKRNFIVDADTVGLSTRWAHVPDNVHYVLWQYRGQEVPTADDYALRMRGPGALERAIAARDLAFGDHLAKLAQHAKVIASDGQFVLFRVDGQIGGSPDIQLRSANSRPKEELKN
jgi:hypothetical protein